MKNWKVFTWALKRLKIDYDSDSDRIYKNCLRNHILWGVMDLSGVKPEDLSFNYKG